MESGREFLNAFRTNECSDRKFVLFLDELSEMALVGEDIRESFLRTLRQCKQNDELYAIHAIFACGTFGARDLTTIRFSPFNNADYFQIPYFTKKQTQQLFDEFARDNRITIDASVIDDIINISNGYVFSNIAPLSYHSPKIVFGRHPGMVCVCGRAISEKLLSLLDTRNLSMKSWQRFAAFDLNPKIEEYMTFRSIIKSLRRNQCKDAVYLLRSRFSGFIGDVTIPDQAEAELADFLTA